MDIAKIEEGLVDARIDIEKNSSEIKSLNDRMDKVEKTTDDIKDLTISVKLMAQSVGTMNDSIQVINDKTDKLNDKTDKLADKIQEVELAPVKNKAKLWDKAWFKLATIAGTGLVAFVLGVLFPQIFGSGTAA